MYCKGAEIEYKIFSKIDHGSQKQGKTAFTQFFASLYK